MSVPWTLTDRSGATRLLGQGFEMFTYQPLAVTLIPSPASRVQAGVGRIRAQDCEEGSVSCEADSCAGGSCPEESAPACEGNSCLGDSPPECVDGASFCVGDTC